MRGWWLTAMAGLMMSGVAFGQGDSALTGRIGVGLSLGLDTGGEIGLDQSEEDLAFGGQVTAWLTDIWSVEGSVVRWSDSPFLSRFPQAGFDITTVAVTARARMAVDFGVPGIDGGWTLEPYAGAGVAYHLIDGKKSHRFDDAFGFHLAAGLETARFDPVVLFFDARLQFFDLDGRFDGEKYSTSFNNLLLRVGVSFLF